MAAIEGLRCGVINVGGVIELIYGKNSSRIFWLTLATRAAGASFGQQPLDCLAAHPAKERRGDERIPGHVYGDLHSLERRHAEARELRPDVVRLRLEGWLCGEGARDACAAARRVRYMERKAIRELPPRQLHGDASLGRRLREERLESTVRVAIEHRSRLDGRHARRGDALPLCPIHAESLELTFRIKEDQSVAVMQRLPALHDQPAATCTRSPYRLADRFRRVKRGDVRPAPVQKVIREPAVKTLLRPRLEGECGAPVRRSAERRVARHDLV